MLERKFCHAWISSLILRTLIVLGLGGHYLFLCANYHNGRSHFLKIQLKKAIGTLRSDNGRVLTTLLATERNWDDDLVLSTVKLCYTTMVFQHVTPSFRHEMQNTILNLELSVCISLLHFIYETIEFKTWIPDQCFVHDALFERNQKFVAVCPQQ